MNRFLRIRTVRNAAAALLSAAVAPLPSMDRPAALTREAARPRVVEYRGLCDASAAVFLGAGRFVVACDEDNTLRVYRRTEPEPARSIPLDGFLKLDGRSKNRETDIEAAAGLGDLTFWITSHGRDKDGEIRPNRHRFFALRADSANPELLVPAGSPCDHLVRDLLADPAVAGLGLDRAASPGVAVRKSLAPKRKGLNIEGLALIPGTRGLWIGFRNPVPSGKALLVPFLNPEEVVFRGSRCRFGRPVLLDLGGLAVRDMTSGGGSGAVWITAGRTDSAPGFGLFRWSGSASDAPVPVRTGLEWIAAESLTPEAFLPPAGGGDALLISDDGERALTDSDGAACPCKKLKRPGDRRFRGAWFPLIEPQPGETP
jgi:hypothetical protein